jgi:hypothetical protein
MTIGRPEDTSEPREGVVLTQEQAKSRRARNIAIGVAVALFVALFYFVTIVKLGGNVVPRAG